MRILPMRENAQRIPQAALWFAQKWQIEAAAYAKSMRECVQKQTGVPQWYVVLQNDTILAGAGVIANDFHDRKDLPPNVCALFVENGHRGRGIAKELLAFIAGDMAKMGINRLYLVTEHTAFYEKCGWQHVCHANGDDGALMRV